MSVAAIGLVLIAAVLHVTWNVLIKTAGDPLRTAAIGMAAAAMVIAPLAAIGWLVIGRPAVPPEAVGLVVVSGVVEVAFFVLLSAAYRRGDLSVVYPIARGTAPLLAVAAGVGLLGERLSPGGWLGVALLLAGLLVVQRPWRVLRARPGGLGLRESAVPFAVATGVAIAVYSSIDRVGVRLVAPWLYAGMLWPVMALGLAGVVAVRGRRRSAGAVDVPKAALGGVLTLAAYLLVLTALAAAPLAVVAPLRESAIVLASGWGAVRLGEAQTRVDAVWRIGAAVLVVAGAALLALAG